MTNTMILTNAVDLAKAVNRMREYEDRVAKHYFNEVTYMWKLEIVKGIDNEDVVKLTYDDITNYVDDEED